MVEEATGHGGGAVAEEKAPHPIEKKAEMEPFIEGGGPVSAPVDKYSLVYLIIFLHGIGTLMPWNMFITIANTYYENYKMLERNETTNALEKSWYSEQYMSAQNICSQLPNLALNFINIFIVVKGDFTKRIGVSLSVVGVCILATMAFINMDTWTWLGGFFYLTLLIVVLLNGANGIYQNSIFGLVSDFPFKYTNAVIIGNNFCGTFVSIISIVSIYVFRGNVPMQAMVYFGLSLATIIACFCSFFALKKLPYYRHYANAKATESKEGEEEEKGVTFAEFIDTFKEGWIGFTNIFLIFFVTLSIFPTTMLNVIPDQSSAFYMTIGADLFHSVMTFLHFNLLAFFGSLLASWKQIISPEKMRWIVYVRALLIPAFIFLNYRPATRGVLPVVTDSTLVFFILGATMSLTSGYLSSLAMMYAPRYVSESRVRIAMMMAAFFLISGIVGGIIFSKVLIELVDLF